MRSPRWPAGIFAVLLLLVLVSADAAPLRTSNAAAQPAATNARGSLEGDITMPRSVARTAERYVSATGKPREVQSVPTVIYVMGPVASARPARASGPTEVVQRGEAFQPQLLVVPVGATVTFPNGDPLFHNVFSYSRPKRFDLGRYPQGESKTVVVDRPGYIKVLCEVHKWMRAGILVVDNPYYMIVPESGRFRIDGIPPGRYRVAVESFDRRSQVDVDVPEGGSARISVTL